MLRIGHYALKDTQPPGFSRILCWFVLGESQRTDQPLGASGILLEAAAADEISC